MMELQVTPARKDFHEKAVRFIKDTSERGILEVAKLLAVGTLVTFSKRDKKLQSILDNLEKSAEKIRESQSTPVHEASRLAIENMMLDHYRDKKTKEIFKSAIAGPLNAVVPHRLADRFQSDIYPSCIDYALLNHLSLEKLGVSGSQVVAFVDNEGLPTFALRYKDQILTYEQDGWIPMEKFRMARRISGRDERVFNVYPTDFSKLKERAANFTRLNFSRMSSVLKDK